MTIEERCKKFATRNYLNSDGEVIATIVDKKVYNNALVVAKTVKKETIDKACEWLSVNGDISDYNSVEELVGDFKKAMEE